MSTHIIPDEPTGLPREDKARIFVGLSGGVDSSVATWLLKKQGHDVVGVFMKNWLEPSLEHHCPSEEDLIDAVGVADHLEIPLRVVDFHQEYFDQVFRVFLRGLQQGWTPNPDILCNSEIKFRCFLDYALTEGAQYIATGHYARTTCHQETHHLLRACDRNKDQSYFLYRLNQTQLAHSLFPLGHIASKTLVRQMAQQIGLTVHNKKDSTGICFVGQRPFRQFLQQYLPQQPGPIVSFDDQRTIGQHQGLAYYTLGQRYDLHIGGLQRYAKNGYSPPWFVCQKDLTHNRLLVVAGKDHPMLYQKKAYLEEVHWIGALTFYEPITAKTRYRQPDQSCHLEETPNGLCISFDEPQWTITPGQSIVLYNEGRCLGGGIIKQAC